MADDQKRAARPRRRTRAQPRPAATEPPPTGQPRPPEPVGDDERALRGLIGAGPSQLSPSAAMRARDASRATGDDLAAAERDLVIVRRNYVPPGPVGKGRTPGRRRQDGSGNSPVRS